MVPPAHGRKFGFLCPEVEKCEKVPPKRGAPLFLSIFKQYLFFRFAFSRGTGDRKLVRIVEILFGRPNYGYGARSGHPDAGRCPILADFQKVSEKFFRLGVQFTTPPRKLYMYSLQPPS